MRTTIHLALLSLIFTSSMAFAQGYDEADTFAADEANPEATFETESLRSEARRPAPRPPRVRWVTMSCGTNSPFGYKECGVKGRILQARLINQRSFLPCKANQSWGAYSNRIWVRFGCNGVFRVQVRDNSRWP